MKRAAVLGLVVVAAALSLHVAGAKGRAEGAVTRPVLFLSPDTAWDYGKGYQDQQGIDAHLRYWKAEHEAGKVFLGGRFVDGKGAMIVAAEDVSARELEKLAEADPAVRSHVLRYEVRQLIVDWAPKAPAPSEDDEDF